MKTNKYFLYLLIFLPLLLLRDFTPDNELKYLSIADEAIRNGNLFTFTNHGEMYADKPPLYLWIVMLGKLLFGVHSMLFLGLFSIIPALIIIYIMDKWVSSEVDQKNRLSGQLMLITSGYFVGTSIVLRMDMLMCMFIVLSLYTFYQIFLGRGTKWSGFLFPFYIFMGLFSKGPIGLLVPLLSVLVFLALEGKLKTVGRYLGVKTWSVLLIGSAIWFTGVYIEGGSGYLHNLLFNQTVHRAIDSFHHKKPFYYYLEVIWYSLAPWSLLYIGVILTGIKTKLINTDLEKFFLTIITVTFVFLSLISSKVEVYMLPAFPFFAYLTVLLLQKRKQKNTFSVLIAVPLVALCLALPAIYVLSRYTTMSFLNNPFFYLLGSLLLISSLVSLFYLYKQKKLNKSVNALSIGLLITIFIGSFFISSFNGKIGYRELSKSGKEIALQKGINSYYFYNLDRGENMDVYLNKELKELKESDLNKKQLGHAILFIQTADIESTPLLKEVVSGKEKMIKGKYSIVVL